MLANPTQNLAFQTPLKMATCARCWNAGIASPLKHKEGKKIIIQREATMVNVEYSLMFAHACQIINPSQPITILVTHSSKLE